MAYLHPLQYEELIRNELREDMGIGGDITTFLSIPAHKTMEGFISSRERGTLAGIQAALRAFSLMNGTIEAEALAEDGDQISPGQRLARLKGAAGDILTAERTALNILSHLSGIATATAAMVSAVRGTGAKITETRKTLPGLRTLQKYAVRCGGGVNHRYSLDGEVLVKDNHLKNFDSWEEGITRLRGSIGPAVKIEVEIDSLDQLEIILNLPVDNVLLDNMRLSDLEKAVLLISGRFVTEASGNITLETVRETALTGVNFISSGALTHSVRALDMGLDAE